METQTKLYPNWKQAVKDAVHQFEYGDVITFEWIYVNFEMVPPKLATPKKWQEYQLTFMAAMANFKSMLLEEHKMYLQNVRGEGYLIVMPGDQSDLSFKKMSKGVIKHIKKGYVSLINVNYNKLTMDERRVNSDKLAVIASLKTIVQRRIGLGENNERSRRCIL